MKKFYLLIVLICAFSLSLFSANSKEIKLNKANQNTYVLIENSQNDFKAQLSISEINLIEKNSSKGLFYDLEIKDFNKNFYYPGKPHLPVRTKLVEIPYGADIEINIISYDEEIIDLNSLGLQNKLYPSQPSISKSDDPADIKFYFDEIAYSTNAFNDNDLIWIDNKGISRGVQFGRLTVCPFKYNPVTNTLIVYNNLVYEVVFNNADLSKSSQLKKEYYSPYFKPLYNSLFNKTEINEKDLITTYPITYVIVSDRAFETTLQPFIQWKTKKGFKVIEAYTDVIGSTTTAIHNYLDNLYQTEVPVPTFVLLVGDINQIPSYSGTTGSHVSDTYYVCFDGSGDIIPDMYIGRFSAETTSECQVLVDKTLMHEQYTWPDESFLDNCVMVAGVDASMAPSHGNGQIYYGIDQYFNTTNGYANIFAYLYGSSTHPYQVMSSDNSGASASIIGKISAGVGFANYTAHCSQSGWADPSFVVSDIPTLTNTGKYPVMIGNCCLSNKFDENSPDCFGEQITHTAERGAVAYIGGSNSTLWDEDFYWSVGVNTLSISASNSQLHTYSNTGPGAYDGVWHTQSQPESDWFITVAELNYTGNLAVESSSSSNNDYYWEIYHIMGDPSLMAYLSIPPQMTISYINPIQVGLTSLVVNTEPYSYVAISENGVLLDAEYAGPNSSVTLTFPAFTTPTTADIVVTKQNRKPYIGTLTVVSANTNYDAGVTSVMDPQINYDCAQYVVPEFTIMNMGQNNLTSLTVGYILDGGAPVTQVWSGNLAQYQVDTVTFPSVLLSVGNHTFEAFTNNPNGNSDEYTANDTMLVNITVNNYTTVAAFSADEQLFCYPPVDVSFTNNSTYADTYYWDFGDGTNSTDENPVHTYTTQGDYSVTLYAYNTGCGADTLVETNFISINPSNPCEYTMNTTGTYNQTACSGILFDSGGDAGNYSDNEHGIYIIEPAGASSVTLNFINFNVEPDYWNTCDYDYLKVYDGNSTSASLIGTYCNNVMPPSSITSSGGAITLEFYSDGSVNYDGFEINWSCMVVGVDAVNNSQPYFIYPNPVNNSLNIETKDMSIKSINIFDVSGKVIYSCSVNDNLTTIDMNAFKTGVYYIQLNTQDGIVYEKIVKTN